MKRFFTYLWCLSAYFGSVIVHFGNMEAKGNLNPFEFFPLAKRGQNHGSRVSDLI